jgi:AraC family transcriptional regulator
MQEPHDLRIVDIKPTRVACYRVIDKSPEIRALNHLREWAAKRNLLNVRGVRIYGFDNPSPSKDKSTYGYEAWLTIGNAIEESEEIRIKEFTGGRYAVIRTKLPDIGESWKELVQWRKSSEYSDCSRQCLEEVLSPPGTPFNDCILDLYLPIE